MNLEELIKLSTPDEYEQNQRITLFLKFKKEIIPNEIVAIISALKNSKPLTENEIKNFHSALSKINDSELHDAIAGSINRITVSLYDENKKKEIEKLTQEIDQKLNNNEELTFKREDLQKKYIDLLNIQALMKGNPLPLKNSYGINFPDMPEFGKSFFYYDIPFAINTLILANKLPLHGYYCGIPLDKPIYPQTIKSAKDDDRVRIKRGIKASDDYFPYKLASKIAKGDSQNIIIAATNGKKILFLRGIKSKKSDIGETKPYSPDAILASKIATFINKEYFSSERLLDKRIAGSRKLSTYAASLADSTVRSEATIIVNKGVVFKGTGIMDEVLNYTGEADDNPENFALTYSNETESASQKNKKIISKDSHFSKIDFDRCHVTTKKDENTYETNILTSSFRSIFKGKKDIIYKDETYIHEKLHTRLKLSILTSDFIRGCAEKAFLDEDDKEKAIQELTNRSTIALNLFLKHPKAKDFLQKNPNILNEFMQDSVKYICGHFEENERDKIIKSIDIRIKSIRTVLIKEFQVELKDVSPFNTLVDDYNKKIKEANQSRKLVENKNVTTILNNLTSIINQISGSYTDFYSKKTLSFKKHLDHFDTLKKDVALIASRTDIDDKTKIVEIVKLINSAYGESMTKMLDKKNIMRERIYPTTNEAIDEINNKQEGHHYTRMLGLILQNINPIADSISVTLPKVSIPKKIEYPTINDEKIKSMYSPLENMEKWQSKLQPVPKKTK